MQEEIIVVAPAKVNLTLDIKGRRPDGYHELETIMHQIELADLVRLRRISRGIVVTVDTPLVPSGEENLAYRAAEQYFKATGLDGGVEVQIEKRIPVGAGLAGGSTDAAAVITGLDRLFSSHLSREEQMRIGLGIGSDVPFCILGGTAVARGRGEVLTPLPLAQSLLMVLAKPPYALSTRQVYGGFAAARVERRPDTGVVQRALADGKLDALCAGMENVLEAVVLESCPEVVHIKHRLEELGAMKALMSGSGPTVFGIFKQRGMAVEACAIMKRYYKDVFITGSL